MNPIKCPTCENDIDETSQLCGRCMRAGSMGGSSSSSSSTGRGNWRRNQTGISSNSSRGSKRMTTSTSSTNNDRDSKRFRAGAMPNIAERALRTVLDHTVFQQKQLAAELEERLAAIRLRERELARVSSATSSERLIALRIERFAERAARVQGNLIYPISVRLNTSWIRN
jgi:hypothetical protein